MNEIIIGQNKMGERIRLQRLSNAMTMVEKALSQYLMQFEALMDKKK